jgi:tRNA (cmo5U34)-methyltransferase
MKLLGARARGAPSRPPNRRLVKSHRCSSTRAVVAEPAEPADRGDDLARNPEETPTGGWSDPSQVSWYLGRIDLLPARIAGEDMLRSVLPAEPRSLLDLGCGDGRLTALALEARPMITEVVAVDVSPPMLDRARERFRAEQRVVVRQWDMVDSVEPLGNFDLVLSGFAIHHLEDERKRRLYAEVAGLLRANGLFANLDVVASATRELHAKFLDAIGRTADDPEDRLVDVETQAQWMRQVGLTQVDCLWRWRGFALLVGTKG